MSALLNLAADDDDGNAAVEKAPVKADLEAAKKMAILAKKEAEKGMEALNLFWRGLDAAERNLLTPDVIKDLKAIATEVDKKDAE
jgi:hypothetical protein